MVTAEQAKNIAVKVNDGKISKVYHILDFIDASIQECARAGEFHLSFSKSRLTFENDVDYLHLIKCLEKMGYTVLDTRRNIEVAW